MLDVAHERVGELASVELLEEGDLRMHRGDDDGGPQLLATGDDDATRAPVLREDALDGCVHADLGAERAGRLLARA
jgi:hypothetical protein